MNEEGKAKEDGQGGQDCHFYDMAYEWQPWLGCQFGKNGSGVQKSFTG
jgi:hypothetical protein